MCSTPTISSNTIPEFSPGSPDESPAAGRSKILTLVSEASPTMRWGPNNVTSPDESPSLCPGRKSGDTGRPRRLSNAPDFCKASLGDVGLGLRKANVSGISGVRKADKAKSPKRPPLGSQRRQYGSLGMGKPGASEREGIPRFLVEGENEDEESP